jgi:hypothetical protein
MSFAACIPSSFNPFSIALLRSIASLSSALKVHPMTDIQEFLAHTSYKNKATLEPLMTSKTPITSQGFY